MKSIQSFLNTYKWLAVTVFNVILIFILANIFLSIAYLVKDSIEEFKYKSALKNQHHFNKDGTPIKTKKRKLSQLRYFDFNSCREIGEKYASEVLDDFYDLDQKSLIYQPWVQFSEPPFLSKRVNVILDKHGFSYRKTINPDIRDNKKKILVLVFGGSTTFGYNVSDEHTWASYLSQILNEKAKHQNKPITIEVVNFGRGGYYPSQELILFLDLLKHGYRPSLAIFLDGVNVGPAEDVPEWTSDIGKMVLSSQSCKFCKISDILFSYHLPIVRFIKSVQNNIEVQSQNKFIGENETELSEYVINRFEQNKKLINLISSLYETKSLFFLQPNHLYNYNLMLYRTELQSDEFLDKRYLRTDKIIYDAIRRKKIYIDLSNLFTVWGENKKALVDTCHYSPAFNKFLASHIAHYIDLDMLKIFPKNFDSTKSTGIKRLVVTRENFEKL